MKKAGQEKPVRLAFFAPMWVFMWVFDLASFCLAIENQAKSAQKKQKPLKTNCFQR